MKQFFPVGTIAFFGNGTPFHILVLENFKRSGYSIVLNCDGSVDVFRICMDRKSV
jgi:hypothetical protein